MILQGKANHGRLFGDRQCRYALNSATSDTVKIRINNILRRGSGRKTDHDLRRSLAVPLNLPVPDEGSVNDLPLSQIVPVTLPEKIKDNIPVRHDFQFAALT